MTDPATQPVAPQDAAPLYDPAADEADWANAHRHDLPTQDAATTEAAYQIAYAVMRHHPGVWYDSLHVAVDALAAAGLLAGGGD